MNDFRIAQFKIEQAYPPIIERIAEVFPGAMNPGVMFCWGDTIFNPSGVPIPDYLIAHENEHRKQQMRLMLDEKLGIKTAEEAVMRWWTYYLISPQFRFEQELPAHQAEFAQFSLDQPARNRRRVMLTAIAKRLSGPLYGNLITFDRAKKLIKEGPQP